MCHTKRSAPASANEDGGRNAFTVVEVLLALFVVAFGILSLVTLFANGLAANAKINAQTQVALFADGIFNGLRAESLHAAESQTNSWEVFWEQFARGDTNISVAAQSMWCGTGIVVRAGVFRTNVYSDVPLHGSGRTNVVNYALRYRLDVSLITNALSGAWTNRADVALRVWPGTGDTTNEADAIVFYTEFENPGDL